MKTGDRKYQNDKQSKGALSFFIWFGHKISDIFKPEEVEVTFNGEGKNLTYTYTKVSQKQVA